MTLSVRLPASLEQKLTAYCAAHHVSRSEAIKEALDRFLSEGVPAKTPYELGKEGFGADHIHGGDIARASKRLLREKFRGQPAR
jgi:Arc/MetJ-type ribon-helix-helix transcriptional regulator